MHKEWHLPAFHDPLPKSGPWANEADKTVWVDPETDLDCMTHRNGGGALCGYVGVGPEHPLHGRDYEAPEVTVHGGLTFASACQEDPEGICHVPEPGREENVWWFGFDCAHLYDLCPSYNRGTNPLLDSYDVYRDMEYVVAEVESLARQLKAMETV